MTPEQRRYHAYMGSGIKELSRLVEAENPSHTDEARRRIMSNGVRELHRLYAQRGKRNPFGFAMGLNPKPKGNPFGFAGAAAGGLVGGNPEPEHDNPGTSGIVKSVLPIALLVGGGFVVYKTGVLSNLGNGISGLASAVTGHVGALAAGNSPTAPSSTANAACYGIQSVGSIVAKTGNPQTDLLAFWGAYTPGHPPLGGQYPSIPVSFTENGQTAYYLPGSGTGFVDAATWQSAVSSGLASAFPVWSGAAGGGATPCGMPGGGCTPENSNKIWCTALAVS